MNTDKTEKNINSKKDLIDDLSKSFNDKTRVYRPVLNVDTGEIHMSFYAGMGSSAILPLSIHKPLIEQTIKEMYTLKELVPDGEPFLQNGCYPLLQTLTLDTTTPF